MIITINPSEEMIDATVLRADKVLMFHNLKSCGIFERVLHDTLDFEKNEVQYIHYYTNDNLYTVGVKEK